MTAEEVLANRRDPKRWFQSWGYFKDVETQKPKRGKANVLQRRIFEHYRQCWASKSPCRMAALKYRRAGCSTSGACLVYMSANNREARLGVIGTDYKASSNMMDMVKFFGEHDDFPGWSRGFEATMETIGAGEWEDKMEKVIATKLKFRHGSTVELYTSQNPESARSAGLNGYHATEAGRWQTGGVQDAAETLSAMRNALPKKGFHFALEESTANGAQGAFYETCRTARWPTDDKGRIVPWAKQWQTVWPLTAVEYGDLQFVFIFAGWFEDENNFFRLTEEQARKVEESLDLEPWHAGEKELIALYEQDGPRGRRLGGEVDATTWEQLAWRRGIIKTVCTKRGLEEFKQEYPSNPAEAFRASGSPALDQDGLLVLQVACKQARPDHGILEAVAPPAGVQFGRHRAAWRKVGEAQSIFTRWEVPIVGAKYIVSWDPMSGAELVTGSGEKDRHSVLCLRDKFTDERGRFYSVRLVARLRPPCQWETKVTARLAWRMALYYGDCTIVVEANSGMDAIKELIELRAQLYQREEFDHVRQLMTKRYGWWNDEGDRRIAISELQGFIREQKLDCMCPHAIGEMLSLIINNKGKAVGGGSNHDDDPISLSMALACLPWASRYSEQRVPRPVAADEGRWREA